MTITKQCSDRIVTIMPNGQCSLDRVLAIQTDLVLDCNIPGYDKDAVDKLVKEVTKMMLASKDFYVRAEVYTRQSK